ncbi:MAG: hypothetical protein AB7D57_10640 [Desulfovibrionaceae bacterium]
MNKRPTPELSRTAPDPDMTEARFARLLEAYGPAPERWPAAERAAALRLAAGSDRAAEALRRTQARDAALEARLDALPPLAPDPGLRRRILTRIDHPTRAERWADAWRGLAVDLAAGVGGPAPALALGSAALLLGALTGLALLAHGPAAVPVDITQMALFTDNFGGF